MLNPALRAVSFQAESTDGSRDLGEAFRQEEAARTRTLEALAAGAPGTAPAPEASSVRVVPPWLTALHGECDPQPSSELFLYRRSLPFDASRFSAWMEAPPRELVRAKGNLWFASEPDRSFGYSCAGAVHRVFPGGPWWASLSGGTWPTCSTDRRRLLARWHPRFGDRRQELVFTGIDLDPARLSAELDRCLVAEDALGDGSYAASHASPPSGSAPGTGLH